MITVALVASKAFIQRPFDLEFVELFSCRPLLGTATSYIISAINQTKRLQQKATETLTSVYTYWKDLTCVSKISIYIVITVCSSECLYKTAK